MARKKSSLLAAPFQGKWRIAQINTWPDDAVDLPGPAFLDINGQDGEMRFNGHISCHNSHDPGFVCVPW